VGLKVVVAATGGIAAIKTPAVIRRLREAGMDVRAAATDGAYRFVTGLSLAVASGSELFDQAAWFAPDGRSRHLELAAWADILVVAPATADAIASAATGRADDVVSALIISGIPRIIWLPAMNTAMWNNPAVRRNVSILESHGHTLLGPVDGDLASRSEGRGLGRMVEPEVVPSAVESLFRDRDLKGKRVLVSAGPTREHVDPVRYFSNPSTGKMGYALAEAARDRGAEVTLVSGPSTLQVPQGVHRLFVKSAEQMLEALTGPFATTDMLIMTAAVADWRPAKVFTEKIAKNEDRLTLDFVRNPDILRSLVEMRDRQVMIGFAMETNQGVKRAAEKARSKGLEFICLNYPTNEDTPFGSDFNQITLVRPNGASEELPRLKKRDLADVILDRGASHLQDVHR
jgi:phosphopantothenoylcysteine decarboxylase/phosphopantothenate--cysteine ligase